MMSAFSICEPDTISKVIMDNLSATNGGSPIIISMSLPGRRIHHGKQGTDEQVVYARLIRLGNCGFSSLAL